MLKRRNTPAASLNRIEEQAQGMVLKHAQQARHALSTCTTEQLQTELRKRFEGADEKLAGSRFELRDGVRAAEVTLLRRALGYYVNAYTEMRRKVTTQHEKDEHQQYITAALALEDKLLRDLVHIKPKEA